MDWNDAGWTFVNDVLCYDSQQVPAVVPVSPVFQVELMKAMAQLEEKKSVTLYVVPQNSLEVVPHSQQVTIPTEIHSHSAAVYNS